MSKKIAAAAGDETHIPTEKVDVNISPPKIKEMGVIIEGTAPYVQNRFAKKAMDQMKTKQQAGSQSRKGVKRDAKDFEECYRQAMHISTEGWHGIPAPAFRNALIDACRLVGFKMTLAKQGLFIIADGFDKLDGTPLVKITKGEPHYVEHPVRNESGVADIRPRPMWDAGWEAEVKIRYDADMFSQLDVVNLMARVGFQVGVGEGRHFSKNSCGLGWGTFQLAARTD